MPSPLPASLAGFRPLAWMAIRAPGSTAGTARPSSRCRASAPSAAQTPAASSPAASATSSSRIASPRTCDFESTRLCIAWRDEDGWLPARMVTAGGWNPALPYPPHAGLVRDAPGAGLAQTPPSVEVFGLIGRWPRTGRLPFDPRREGSRLDSQLARRQKPARPQSREDSLLQAAGGPSSTQRRAILPSRM